MTWLEPDSWLDAWGAPARGLRGVYHERGGEDALAHQLEVDPRRCVALVGEAGSGTSRLALELAGRSAVAVYRDPIAPPDPERDADALAERLAGVADDERPVAVLDGPDRAEALAPLRALLERRVHPRLLVVVPCTDRVARRLSHIAGSYPRGSILVAGVAGEGGPPAPLPDGLPRQLLAPFALAGRCPLDVVEGQEELAAAGLLAPHDGSGTVLCVADERRRFEVARAELLTDSTAIAAMLDRYPALRRPAFETALRWLGGLLPDPALESMTAFSAGDFPDMAELAGRGLLIAPPVVVRLMQRATELLPGTTDPDGAAAIRLQLARGVAVAGGAEQGVRYLEEALALPVGEAMRGELMVHLAVARCDADLCAQAVDVFRRVGDGRAQADAMRRWIELLRGVGRADDAIRACAELVEHERARGCVAGAGGALTLGASLAGGNGDVLGAIARAEASLEQFTAVGDVRSETLALYRLASLHGHARNRPAARAVVERALAVEVAIGNRAGEGYAHWMLGGLADQDADPVSAARHYAASIAGYEAVGPVPERLRESLARAERRSGGGADAPAPAGEQGPGEPLELPEDAPVEQLVQISIPPRKA